METNVIILKFDKATTRIGGFPMGRATYEEQVKDKIDYSKKNVIVFPQQIIKVASSFTQGFFSEMAEQIGYVGIEKTIEVQASSDKLVEDIMADLLN